MGEKKERESSPLIQAKRAEKKEKYIAAARELISEHGIAEASVQGLARRLEMSPGALYWYFPSREALIGEVQRRVFSELGDEFAQQTAALGRAVAQRTSDEGTRALAILFGLARFYLGMPERNPEHARVIGFSLDPRVWLSEEEAALFAPVLVRVFREVALPFHDATALGALEPGSSIARAVQLWTALQGLVQVSKLSRLAPQLFDVPALGMATTEALLRGWGAQADTIAAARAVLSQTSVA